MELDPCLQLTASGSRRRPILYGQDRSSACAQVGPRQQNASGTSGVSSVGRGPLSSTDFAPREFRAASGELVGARAACSWNSYLVVQSDAF